MQKDRLIELLEDQIRSLKEQLEAAARREEHGQLLICELTMQVRQLTESVHSLEEALTLKNGKLKKQENISRGLGKLISNESENRVKRRRSGRRLPPVHALLPKSGETINPNARSILNWKRR